MTSQSSDTQPALHSHNVSVQGGRLTKFKGRVASIAPGLSVVVVAAVVSTAGVDQAAAQAADACGGPTNGVVTCAAGPYADGITYNTSGPDDLSLILNEDDVTVRGSGARVVGSTSGEGNISMQLQNGKVITDASSGFVVGLLAQINNTASTATATVRMTDGEINTTGANHHGILADNKGLGDAIALMEGGKITTSGGDTYGLWATVGHAQSTDSATASVTGGEINVGGIWSHGLYAINRGLGAATVQMDGGSVTTSRLHARALYAEITNQNSEARATASATGDAKIKTVDRKAYGLLAKTNGLGDTLAAIDRSSITTLGREAHGLWAEITNTASTATSTAHMNESNINTIADDTYGLLASTEGRSGGALAQMSGGRVTTLGEDAHGLLAYVHEAGNEATATVRMTKGDVETIGEYSHALWADNRGRGSATVQLEGGTVTTAGKGAYGLLAGAYGGGSAVVDLGTDATVRVYGADADGIRAEGATGFDVDVAGRVTGGAGNGAAIRTISGAGGEIDIASGAIVTAGGSGIVIVDWNGDAVVTVKGHIDGEVFLGAGDDSFTLEATASFDFSHVLDGGSGDNDHLTLHGRTMTSMGNVRNWEHLTLNDTHLSLDGMDRLDMGLSIDATSTFSASGGSRSTGATTAGKVANVPGGGITIAGDVTNAGEVTLSVQDGAAGDVIRVEGNYTNTGSGRSVFELDAVMGADGANTDRLEITGNASGEIGLSLAGLDSASAGGAPLAI
ncbi:hypothetical protein GS959_21835, partial [Roseobacter sp. HKCCD8768]|nr:hypothetical protein [Roseobacter sp. HKCCD8768]NNW73084.1 hypothetical protein [Roseobacter sp. HKCCD8193]NNX83793.1 hypothetical protein [Roseobacter sp. HKCCD8877]NNZ24367.1 hypothetical protein [Roseobacter sp. HKCCD5930]NNZ66923.1 hypothetical protein [Roseobacter sp. HKCCD5928]NPU04868.1 hypothetical protein [Roseobacter sp. HKCCD6491]